MANPLTGDFEAVLQVSGVTINRLLASMHQNDGGNPSLPTMPHNAVLRIGDPKLIEGMRGSVWAQIAVPRIDLIHGSTDHFWLETDVRARYKADPGTKPLPEFIHGLVRAQYRLEPIDPSCLGWGKRAAEYLWIRVVDDSVSFRGTAVDDLNVLSLAGLATDDAEVNGRLTRLFTRLLKTTFEATPHHVSKRFRQGAMRSLHIGVNQSAVVLPIGLSGEPVAGRVDSITQDLLDGSDFGVGISREFILAKIQPALNDVRDTFHETFGIKSTTTLDVIDTDILTVEITWGVTLNKATAAWTGGWVPLLGLSVGVITLSVSGQATTSNAAFNMTFDVIQIVTVTFDESSERFVVNVAGPPEVHVQPHAFEDLAKSRIQGKVKPQVQPVIDQLASQLDLSTRKAELIEQLRTIDSQADAHFDEAVFSPDGVVVRGRVILSPRRKPVNAYAITDEADGFSAFESWIPGGGISQFEWSWSPFNNSGTPGHQTADDRFILRRPSGHALGKFGAVLGTREPLPGLDAGGTVCLNVTGLQVHPQSGARLAVSSGRKCRRFGFDVRAISAIGKGRLFMKEFQVPPGDPSGPVQELGVVEVARSSGGPAANTLVVYVGEKWNAETAASLRDGLQQCRRTDAGMVVLLLFREGALEAGGADLRQEIDRLAEHAEAPILANEDVQGSWSAALALGAGNRGRSWRLVSPGGGVTWMHEGHLAADALAHALDHFLLPSKPPDPRPQTTKFDVGTQLAVTALHPGYADLIDVTPRCPPLPMGRFGGLGAAVAFVQPRLASSHAELRALAARGKESGANAPVLIAIVDGADADEAERLKHELGIDCVALPDPDGIVATRFGIRTWPTTVSVNGEGRVSRIDVGHTPTTPPRENRDSASHGPSAQ